MVGTLVVPLLGLSSEPGALPGTVMLLCAVCLWLSAGAARGRILEDLRSRAISEHAQRSGCPRHEERDYSVAEQRSKRYGRPRGGAPGPARRPGRRAS